MNSRAETKTDPETATARAAAAPRPLAEVFARLAGSEQLLEEQVRTIVFASGETIFRQGERVKGLYLVVQGVLTRRAMRQETRVDLGRAREGGLLELAAALGDGVHTYTLKAETDGMLLLLPAEALGHALEADAVLRMQLLEELAREISRGYAACQAMWTAELRKHGRGPAA